MAPDITEVSKPNKKPPNAATKDTSITNRRLPFSGVFVRMVSEFIGHSSFHSSIARAACEEGGQLQQVFGGFPALLCDPGRCGPPRTQI
ncbi:hypothetical protein D3C71_1865490 [compost metagenome]